MDIGPISVRSPFKRKTDRVRRGYHEIAIDTAEKRLLVRLADIRESESKAMRLEVGAYKRVLGVYEDLDKDYDMKLPEGDDDTSSVDGVGMIQGAIKGLDLPGGEHTRNVINGFLGNPDNRDKVNLFIGNKFNEFLSSQTKGGKDKLELISK